MTIAKELEEKYLHLQFLHDSVRGRRVARENKVSNEGWGGQ